MGAPKEIRERLEGADRTDLTQAAVATRPRVDCDPVRNATKIAISVLGRRRTSVGQPEMMATMFETRTPIAGSEPKKLASPKA
jgi:hypothetical protein